MENRIEINLNHTPLSLASLEPGKYRYVVKAGRRKYLLDIDMTTHSKYIALYEYTTGSKYGHTLGAATFIDYNILITPKWIRLFPDFSKALTEFDRLGNFLGIERKTMFFPSIIG